MKAINFYKTPDNPGAQTEKKIIFTLKINLRQTTLKSKNTTLNQMKTLKKTLLSNKNAQE